MPTSSTYSKIGKIQRRLTSWALKTIFIIKGIVNLHYERLLCFFTTIGIHNRFVFRTYIILTFIQQTKYDKKGGGHKIKYEGSLRPFL